MSERGRTRLEPPDWKKLADNMAGKTTYTVSVDPLSLATMISENEALKKRVDELLDSNNQHVLASRKAKTINRGACLREFSAIAGHKCNDEPGEVSEADLRLALRLIGDEFCELLDAALLNEHKADYYRVAILGTIKLRILEFVATAPVSLEKLDEVVKESIDVAYTLESLLARLGVDSNAAWREVHASNMTKKGGPIVNGKLCKPEWYRPADIKKVLERQKIKETTLEGDSE